MRRFRVSPAAAAASYASHPTATSLFCAGAFCIVTPMPARHVLQYRHASLAAFFPLISSPASRCAAAARYFSSLLRRKHYAEDILFFILRAYAFAMREALCVAFRHFSLFFRWLPMFVISEADFHIRGFQRYFRGPDAIAVLPGGGRAPPAAVLAEFTIATEKTPSPPLRFDAAILPTSLLQDAARAGFPASRRSRCASLPSRAACFLRRFALTDYHTPGPSPPYQHEANRSGVCTYTPASMRRLPMLRHASCPRLLPTLSAVASAGKIVYAGDAAMPSQPSQPSRLLPAVCCCRWWKSLLPFR